MMLTAHVETRAPDSRNAALGMAEPSLGEWSCSNRA